MKSWDQTLAQQTVKQLLTTCPETAVVFKRHNMACIGCDVSHLYTIAEVANVYQIPIDEFLSELESSLDNPESAYG